MDVTNFGKLKGAQSGPQAQKYHFWVSFVSHVKFSKFYPNHRKPQTLSLFFFNCPTFMFQVNSLTFSCHDNTKSFSFISPTNLYKSLYFELSTRVLGCSSPAKLNYLMHVQPFPQYQL